MYSGDERKVVALSRRALHLRADFFDAAAKRNPRVGRQFHELAASTREVAQLVFPEGLPPEEAKRIREQHQRRLSAIYIAAAKQPAVMEELRESRKLLMDEIKSFNHRHPELAPVREEMLRKLRK